MIRNWAILFHHISGTFTSRISAARRLGLPYVLDHFKGPNYQETRYCTAAGDPKLTQLRLEKICVSLVVVDDDEVGGQHES